MEPLELDDTLQHMVSQLTSAEKLQLLQQLAEDSSLEPNEDLLRLPLTSVPELHKLKGQYSYELNTAQNELWNSPDSARHAELVVIHATLTGRIEVVDYFISLATFPTHPTEGN